MHCAYILPYVPYLAAAGELKTKPTQHSVKVASAGIQPDISRTARRTRTEAPAFAKVVPFCNVDENAVVQKALMLYYL